MQADENNKNAAYAAFLFCTLEKPFGEVYNQVIIRRRRGMIRKIQEKDRNDYIEMARGFYSTDAVAFKVGDSHFHDTFDELMRSDIYAEGYIFEKNATAAGYALLAKTFSQEAGGIVVWIEEIYVKPEYRSQGIGGEFFRYVKENIFPKVKRLRLEAERENTGAISLYEKQGFRELEYMQMYIDSGKS